MAEATGGHSALNSGTAMATVAIPVAPPTTDMHTHANSAFDNCMILTFDLLTSESMHAKRMQCTVHVQGGSK